MPFSPLAFMKSTGEIARALIDSGRRVIVTGDNAAPLPVISTSSDKLLGYSAAIAAITANATHAAGALNVDSAAVPAGEVWILDTLVGINTTNVLGAITLKVLSGGNFYEIPTQTVTAGSVQTAISNPIVLSPGEQIRAAFTVTNLNDNCQVRLHGYKSHTT